MSLHQGHRLGSQQFLMNGAGVGGHRLSERCGAQIGAICDRSPQIAVGKDAEQLLVV